ncbi:hypothetical protein GCM10010497_45900 [Streptomyces cinereoruber]|uniref:DUF2637 domain-containing protein n=1 Tax=Streptomyces cinereoruber TaxID=67260 RepID=A0AAV4KPG0_9ACTN|nr:DUF2637 domain-containing protein [Streptomyces cinereoruber]MBB4160059.1 hypothetical protein [Streptomyces cinereoruber]MBY8818330.1 DUF2637 domain-containing protein [Streptomyces cinereoruber]NIH60997.1 hypothetical protein [Streptomyces cinereoruber]QEV33288.1 DUF2637 domain-containing protein [Streptomyces cinereoruber]GGR37844.1 hypothetical protein GCM10010497_45900 [Streptomyces cinereoruber]
MKNLNAFRALAIGAGVVIIALTGAAFWLSYAHLAEVALGHGLGQAPARAWAWPATLDLFIVAGELLMLRAALAKRVDGWAIALTAVGSVGSIVLNVAGVTGTRDPGTVPVLDYVVAAVPPTAALLAFGALMRQIHQALAKRETPAAPDTQPEATAEAPEAVAEEAPALPEVVPAGVRLLPLTARPEPVTEAPAVVTRPVILLPAKTPMWDDFATGEMTALEPARPTYRLDSFEERLVPVDPVEEVTAQASAVPAEQPRQVVTETVALSPTELRKRARALHRQAVRSGARGVTIEQLRDELNLSRREATELRRQVVTEGAS